MRGALISGLLLAALAAPAANAQPNFPGQAQFRALYQELVEIDSTVQHGSCTKAVNAMAARLRAAGYPDGDIQIYAPAERPQDGNLIALLHGTNAKLKPILLLAHVDVVEAKREDWARDPFKLVEENGYFYGRGVADDKSMAASFTDALIRYRQEGFKPKRGVKLALTCGEESPDTFNGVDWLLKTHPGALDAEFALNEGAGGRIENGKRVFLGVQAGEKVYQDYQLEVTNPGGHSSRPVKDNAIVHLSGALTRIGAYDFPIRINEATKLYFDRMGALVGGDMGTAMRAAAAASASPPDAAIAVIVRDPSYNSMMRTTCVPTMVDAGHAQNALPQRARANVNCRILPGQTIASVMATLAEVAGDPAVKVTLGGDESPASAPPPLTPRVLGPATKVAAQMWPGLPIIPAMSTGATDSRFLLAAGIPAYGLSGAAGEPDGGGVHGLNERIRVDVLYEAREYLYRVVKLYANEAK